MALTTTPLIGGAVLVKGTDSTGTDGTAVIRSEIWTQVKEYRAKKEAQSGFDAEVLKFFKPLTDAAEAFNATVESDGLDVVVINEGTEGIDAVEAEKVRLDAAGTVLRILEEGDHDLLRWVGDELVAIKA